MKTLTWSILMLGGFAAIGAACVWTFVAIAAGSLPWTVAAIAAELCALVLAACAMRRAEDYI